VAAGIAEKLHPRAGVGFLSMGDGFASIAGANPSLYIAPIGYRYIFASLQTNQGRESVAEDAIGR